jgi:hypothetical protein
MKYVGVGDTQFRDISTFQHFDIQTTSDLSLFFSHSSTLFCAFLRLWKTQPFSFQAIPHSLPKTPGVGVG